MAATVYDFSLLISKKSSELDKLPDKSNFCQFQKKGEGFVCLFASYFGNPEHYGVQVIGVGVWANWLLGKHSQEAEMNDSAHGHSRCIGEKSQPSLVKVWRQRIGKGERGQSDSGFDLSQWKMEQIWEENSFKDSYPDLLFNIENSEQEFGLSQRKNLYLLSDTHMRAQNALV